MLIGGLCLRVEREADMMKRCVGICEVIGVKFYVCVCGWVGVGWDMWGGVGCVVRVWGVGVCVLSLQ